MRGNTKKTAICGVFAALALTALFFGTVVEVLDLTSAAVASGVVFVVSRVYGAGVGGMLYAVVLVLSFVLFTGRFSPIAFAFLGFYPIVKIISEKYFQSKVLVFVFKFLVFNLAFTAFLYVGKGFLFAFDETGKISFLEIIIAYPVGNFFVILFDRALSLFMLKYGPSIARMLN